MYLIHIWNWIRVLMELFIICESCYVFLNHNIYLAFLNFHPANPYLGYLDKSKLSNLRKSFYGHINFVSVVTICVCKI